MKQNDIAALVLAVTLSLAGSWFLLNAIIPEPTTQESQVEVVDPISAEFPQPDPRVFAEGYINPTELIEIDNSDNQQPFNQ
jgi:hypothetical protein